MNTATTAASKYPNESQSMRHLAGGCQHPSLQPWSRSRAGGPVVAGCGLAMLLDHGPARRTHPSDVINSAFSFGMR